MEIVVEGREGGIAVVRIEGDLVLASARALRRALSGFAPGRELGVVVDLEKVGYMDSSGIATLFEAFQRVRRAGGRFELASLQRQTAELLRLCRLDRVFSIHSSVERAIQVLEARLMTGSADSK